MIIKSNTTEGQRTVVYLKNGNRCTLPIEEYNTETQEAKILTYDDKGHIKMSPWIPELGTTVKKMVRSAIYETVKLEGSYAEIGGKRV